MRICHNKIRRQSVSRRHEVQTYSYQIRERDSHMVALKPESMLLILIPYVHSLVCRVSFSCSCEREDKFLPNILTWLKLIKLLLKFHHLLVEFILLNAFNVFFCENIKVNKRHLCIFAIKFIQFFERVPRRLLSSRNIIREFISFSLFLRRNLIGA